MKIELKQLKIKDVLADYIDKGYDGVFAYNGKLNIRPPYQREFVYKEKQRNDVINSIQKGFPLNVMYWSKNEDGTYEVIDGQQRTISIGQYLNGDFSVDYKYFHNLTKTEQDQILNYELMIYICEGNDKEKLDWFKIINIAGEKLKDQELRNALYTGPWLMDAKKHFSKNDCVAYNIAKKYMAGSPIRQDYLETVLSWIKDENEEIEDYMSKHQFDSNADELWDYFEKVIDWVKLTFPNYRNEMKGLSWGIYYNKYKVSSEKMKIKDITKKIDELMLDDDVTNKKGIYEYVLSGDEKYLNIRAFTESEKRKLYEQQKGICNACKKHFEIEEMEADHIAPWSQGGKTEINNGQMLCKECNRRKSNK